MVAYAPIPEVFLRANLDGIRDMNAQKITAASVISNVEICREHYRLTLGVVAFPEASPGQFVHLGSQRNESESYRTFEWGEQVDADAWRDGLMSPLLRRAFSIAGLRRVAGRVEIDVIYRVVGKGTTWLAGLRAGDSVSVLGPLGRGFPISDVKKRAWLVAGGVGLPPMLWLAEALHGRGIGATAFCGAQTKELLPLTIRADARPDASAHRATESCEEFARSATPVVISTDDGSLGFHGHVGSALTAFHDAQSIDANDVVVYTCGPERMMAFVAGFCDQHHIECYVCMERAMACGTGMCQSCVVPVRDYSADGWHYELCCTDGPVFRAADVLWDEPA